MPSWEISSCAIVADVSVHLQEAVDLNIVVTLTDLSKRDDLSEVQVRKMAASGLVGSCLGMFGVVYINSCELCLFSTLTIAQPAEQGLGLPCPRCS